jgi:hypothetical protein
VPWFHRATLTLRCAGEPRRARDINRRLKEGHADHPYIPLLLSAPGIGWVLAFRIAAEIGAIERFSSPEKLTAPRLILTALFGLDSRPFFIETTCVRVCGRRAGCAV